MKKTRQSGFVLVFSVLALPIILAINGFSVALMDYYSGQVQTRIATSAAARAATEELCPQEKCWKSARKVAAEMLTQYAVNSGSAIKVSIPDVQNPDYNPDTPFEDDADGIWDIGESEYKSTISIERGYLAEADDPGPSGIPQSPTFHSLEKDSWRDGKIELVSGACENDPDSDLCRSVPSLNNEPILPAWSFVNAVKVKVNIPQTNRLFKNFVPQTLLSVQESQVASMSNGIKQPIPTGPFAIPLCSLLTQNKANGPLEFRPQEFEGIDILFTAADRNCKDPNSVNCKNMPGYGLMPAFSASPATEFTNFQGSVTDPLSPCVLQRSSTTPQENTPASCLISKESPDKSIHYARYYHAVTRSNFGVIGGTGNESIVKAEISEALEHYQSNVLTRPAKEVTVGSRYHIFEPGLTKLTDVGVETGNRFFKILNKETYSSTEPQNKNQLRSDTNDIDTNFSFFSILRNSNLSKTLVHNEGPINVTKRWDGLATWQGDSTHPISSNWNTNGMSQDLVPPLEINQSSSNRVFTARNRGLCPSALLGASPTLDVPIPAPATEYTQNSVGEMFPPSASPQVASTTWHTLVPIIYDFKSTCSQDPSNIYIDTSPQPSNIDPTDGSTNRWNIIGYIPVTLYDYSLGIWRYYPNAPTAPQFRKSTTTLPATYYNNLASASSLYPPPSRNFYFTIMWAGPYPDTFNTSNPETLKQECNFVRGRIPSNARIDSIFTPNGIEGNKVKIIKDVE